MTELHAVECRELGQRLQLFGLHQEALAVFERAAKYLEDADGEQSPNLADSLMDEAESLLELCRYQEAVRKARSAKMIVDAIGEQVDRETRGKLGARAFGLWGCALRGQGRYEEAAAPLLAAVRESPPETLAEYLNDYGVLCKYGGKFDEGERAYLFALALIQDKFGKESPETASLYQNLGSLAHARRGYAKGEPLARKAYETRRDALGDEDAATIAGAVAWAALLDGLGRYKESMPIYRRALAYCERRFGHEHFEVAAILNNLGMAEATQGSLHEARVCLERCLRIKRKLFRPGHPEVLLTECNLAAVVAYCGDAPLGLVS